jgi:Flp pilus assembly protein TadG
MKKFKLLMEENGATVVFVALFMTILLGMTGVVIDGGRLYLEKSQLQKALDAGVLAGAQELRVSQLDAENATKHIALENDFQVDTVTAVFNNYVKATKETTVPLTFAKVLGFNDAKVSASAKAIVAPLKSVNGMSPIAIEKGQVPSGTSLNCGSNGPIHGNCGYLDIAGGGANGVADALLNGAEVAVGDEYVETSTGVMWGPIKSSIETIIEADAEKPHCQSSATADSSCKRVVYVSIVESWIGVNGKSEIKVVGLASYWISGIDNSNKSITGKFIKTVAQGELGEPGTGAGEYSLYGVKLDD